jgi:hypothetical protein
MPVACESLSCKLALQTSARSGFAMSQASADDAGLIAAVALTPPSDKLALVSIDMQSDKPAETLIREIDDLHR